ncbi:MAG: invasion associated locus B family protein [Magnetococcales bacterium]|nr:invasion associated locus B family protein [Magnetococcales bacterium]
MKLRGMVAVTALLGVVLWAGLALFPEQAWSEKKKEKPADPPSGYADPAKPSASTNPLHGKVFGSWEIACEASPDSQEKCYATQNQISVEKKVRVLKFSVGRLGAQGEWVAVAILPLGISIPGGVAFKVDDDPQVSMPLQQCTGDGCVAALLLDKKVLASIKAGKVLHVGMMPAGGTKTMEIPVNLDGLSAALAPLAK